MFQRLCLPALVIALLVGCGVSEDNWIEDSAKSSCKFTKRCDTATFWATHDDVDACIDSTITLLHENDEYYSTCIYDSDSAKQCLKALDASCKSAGADYEELFAPCLTVYDCGGDGADGT
ncbi:MAG: hypothetical protein GWP91_17185 [Rhodobacterales bacterium]|nr:hypothetical protein [Rhodobacterales bacterium]